MNQSMWNNHKFIKMIIFALSSLLIALILRFVQANEFSSIFFFCSLYLTIVYHYKMDEKIKLYGIINFFVSVFIAWLLFSKDITVFSDSNLYIGWISQLSQMPKVNLSIISKVVKSLHIGYEAINYYIYVLFDSFLALQLFNVFLASVSYLLFYRLLIKTFNISVANGVFLYLNTSVYLKVFTTSILKDGLVLFLCISSIVVYKEMMEDFHLLKAAVLFMLIVLLLLTRIYAAVGIILGIALDFVINMRNKRLLIPLILLGILGFLVLFVLGPFKSYLKLMLNFLKSAQLNLKTIAELAKFSLSFLFSPFAWNMTHELSAYTILTIDSTTFLVLSPLLIFAILYIFLNKDYRRNMYIYLVPIFIHIFALGTRYKTGGVRQKMGVYPFLVLIYVLGFYLLYQWRRNNRIDFRLNKQQ